MLRVCPERRAVLFTHQGAGRSSALVPWAAAGLYALALRRGDFVAFDECWSLWRKPGCWYWSGYAQPGGGRPGLWSALRLHHGCDKSRPYGRVASSKGGRDKSDSYKTR